MSTDDDLSHALAEVLDPVLGRVTIEHQTRLSAGASRETWSFDAIESARRRRGTRHQLILQRDRSDAAGEASARDAELMTYARRGGAPTPEVVTSGRTPNPLGRSFSITRRLAGETIARRLLRDDDYAAARAGLLGDFGRALAGIHRLDPAPMAGVLSRVDDPVRSLRDLLDGLTARHPVFELALRWLTDHRPEPRPTRIVHGDFRLGNLLVDRGGLVAVLDWELAHLGDPIEDLGWLCVRAWRFGAVPAVAGLGDRELLLAAYRAESGVEVGLDELRWWEVYGTLKWGLTTLVMGTLFQPGVPALLEQGVIARRVAETEYDLYLLLHPEAVVVVAAGSPDPALFEPSPHDPPDAGVLLDTVRAFLTDDLTERVGGRDRFLARVAANAIGIAERELRLGQLHAERHHDRLAAFGVERDVDLAAAIRDGRLDDRFGEIAAALGQATLDKLAVANPGYLAPF
jgi:aminoglycoside phosphotransferase (APT) family kinase protein